MFNHCFLEYLYVKIQTIYRAVRLCLPAGDDDGLLAVPVLVVLHDARVGRDVLGRQLRQLVGLRVDPTQWLHLLQYTWRGGMSLGHK